MKLSSHSDLDAIVQKRQWALRSRYLLEHAGQNKLKSFDITVGGESIIKSYEDINGFQGDIAWDIVEPQIFHLISSYLEACISELNAEFASIGVEIDQRQLDLEKAQNEWWFRDEHESQNSSNTAALSSPGTGEDVTK